jgi:phenylalanine-4-hydroxylase
MTDVPQKITFDPEKAASQSYPITSFQPLYFVADSFRSAQEKVREWAAVNLKRPFTVRYNPYTQAIDILDSVEKIAKVAQDIRTDLDYLIDSLNKFPL